ncbi:MAG: hypothetical protein IPG79_07755 [Saprospiraceae bacterium]|nr:hypothetical protein [Saprospiraceae bacterium]
MKKICILLMFSFPMSSQNLVFQNGISFSLYFGNEFKYLLSYNPNLSYPLEIGTNQAIIPMADLKISFYNNNLGSSVLKSFRNHFFINMAFLRPLVIHLKEPQVICPDIYLYFPILLPGLQIPIMITISVFRQPIFFRRYGKVKKYERSQRLGNIFVYTRYVYLNYYNDGGPVNKWFGDKEDRYWTGGGAVGFKYFNKGEIHYLSLAFDKYSGFIKNAFEASGLLYSDQVMYKNPLETSYNSSKYTLRYVNPGRNFGAAVNWWDTPFDFQDFLHRDVSSDPFHFKLRKKFVDFEIMAVHEN